MVESNGRRAVLSLPYPCFLLLFHRSQLCFSCPLPSHHPTPLLSGNSSDFGIFHDNCIQGNRGNSVENFNFNFKIFLIALTLIMDYHLTLWYIVVFSVIYVLTQQPPYEELGTSSKLTPLQLEALLTEGNTSRFWLVEFRASFSSSCRRSSRCFPELSITYSNKNLSFGIVDLGLFPNAAEKFGISPGASMGQLPTYILFENATEITRFPEFNFEAKPTPPITKRLLSRYFELDRHLLEYVKGK
ncbi:hypothetical protein PTKIN_Ptkin19aG0108100 [Pterospermum kingtungense]